MEQVGSGAADATGEPKLFPGMEAMPALLGDLDPGAVDGEGVKR
jgi:hypothetical protein